MRYRRFGRTGLFVSELCLGTMTFSGKGFWAAIGTLGGSEAEALVDAALDAGVNFIDTAVGFCNLPAWLAMKALAHADARGLARFVSAQMYCSLAGRDIEREVVPLARDERLAILPWSPLAGGLLSGKYNVGKPGTRGRPA